MVPSPVARPLHGGRGSAGTTLMVHSPVAKQLHEARGIQSSMTELLQLRVELIDQRSARELGTVCACLFQSNAQVLTHEIDCEAEVELAIDHGVTAIFHLPG